MWSYLTVFSLLLLDAHAITLDFHVNVRSEPARTGLQRRALYNATFPVMNTKNSEYIANITLGGRQIPVLLDTGSSDLWVTGDIPQTKDLGKHTSLHYAVGNAAGGIHSATLDFGNYTIPDQTYLQVADAKSFTIDIVKEGFEGLLGLGPNSGSVIRDDVDDKTNGDSVLQRIFSMGSTATNYITMYLSRNGDGVSPPTGVMTISEIYPQFAKITEMPKLPVISVHRLTDEDQHWQVYTDVNGVIGPDGQPIIVDSIVPAAPDGQLVVIFDSGFTLPQVPRDMADAIYGRVPGAKWDELSQVWLVPCDQYIPLTFKFGGVSYPIHPLDASSSDFQVVDETGTPICVGTFQPITSAFSLLGEYDIILGMSFMRNTYTLMDYGSFIQDTSFLSSKKGDPPFIQLLALTDVAEAKKQFLTARTGGVDTTGDAAHQLLPVDKMQHSPVSEEEKKKRYAAMILSRWPYIFVGCLVGVSLIIGLIVWRCCIIPRRKKAKHQAALSRDIGASGSNSGPMTFGRLEDGARPAEHMEMRDKYDGYAPRSSFSSSAYHAR